MQKGQVIANEFMLQRSFEEGPTGEVWRALELNVGRMVRLRFLPEKFVAAAEAMELLRNRFETLKLFTHPHVVVPERLVEPSGSMPFLVSRFVEGPFLDEYADQWTRAEGSFPFNLIFEVFRPVAAALDEAKARNLVHRSLSPKRIVVSQTEGVQIFDFDLTGIVRECLERNDPEFFARNAESSRYLAPEQLLEEPVTPQTDQYSLGTLVAELLLGRPWIDVEPTDRLRQGILTPPPLILPNQAEHVVASLQKALHRNPGDRFPSCASFLDGLAGQLAVSPPSVPVPVGLPSHAVVPPPVVVPPVVSPPNPSLLPEIITSAESSPNISVTSVEVKEISKPLSSESVASFESISSAARQASAATIASKIRKERRFQRMFYVWNFLVLLACLIAAFVFRDHIGRVWKQRDKGASPVIQQLPSPENETKNMEPTPRQSRSASRSRTREKKEEDFTDTNATSFRNIDGGETPDEVRFVGTSGTGKRIVFVVDASAVMGGGKRSPWEYVQKELVFSFKDLNPSQRFQVIYYNENVGFLPGGQESGQWISVSPETLKNAHQFLRDLKTSGRGSPAEALKQALALRPDQVFFLADRNSAALTPPEINALKSAAGTVPIHTVELGSGQEPNVASSIRLLAQACRGEYKWVNGDLHGLNRTGAR